MPTQKGMSSSTEWKPEAGEPMGEKKNRERFTIKYNHNDPAHDAVIRLLEKQGSHSKAQFIVNAVLHYVNCPETPDVSLAQTADRASIKKIVMEILHDRDSGQQDSAVDAGSRKMIRTEQVSAEPSRRRCDTEPEQKKIEFEKKEIDEGTWAMIADTMSAFRNS